MINDLYKRFRTLILYGLIGCVSSGLDFCVFSVLVQFIGIYYIIANCISVIVGITTSFCLNRAYNFKVKDDVFRRFAIFLFVGLCGLCLSNLILWMCVDKFMIGELFSKIASIVIVVFFQFIANKTITFRKK